MPRTLEIGIGLRDNLSRDLRRATSRLNRFRARVTRSFVSIGRAIFNVRNLLGGLFVGYGTAGLARQLGEFEQTMLRIKAITRATPDQMEHVTEAVRLLGRATRYTSREVADAALVLTKSFGDLEKTGAMLPAMLDYATAAQIESLEMAAQDVSALMAGFARPGSHLRHFTDVLVNTANKFKTTAHDLAVGIAESASIYETWQRKLGNTMAFEELASIMGFLQHRTLTLSKANINLRNILLQLVDPTTENVEKWQMLGFAMEDISPLLHSILDIFEKIAQSPEAEAAFGYLFERRTTNFAQIVRENIGEIRKLAEENAKLAGESRRVAAELDVGLYAALKRVQAALEGVLLRGGFEGGLVGFLTAMFNRFAVYLNSGEFQRGLDSFISAVKQIWVFMVAWAQPAGDLLYMAKQLMAIFKLSDLTAWAWEKITRASKEAAKFIKEVRELVDDIYEMSGGAAKAIWTLLTEPAHRLFERAGDVVGQYQADALARAIQGGFEKGMKEAEKNFPTYEELMGRYPDFRDLVGEMQPMSAEEYSAYVKRVREMMRRFHEEGKAEQKADGTDTILGREEIDFTDMSQGAQHAARDMYELGSAYSFARNMAHELTVGQAEGLANALVNISLNAQSAGEAFSQMAKSMLADMAKLIIKFLFLQSIMALLGLAGFSLGGPVAAIGGAVGGAASSFVQNPLFSGGSTGPAPRGFWTQEQLGMDALRQQRGSVLSPFPVGGTFGGPQAPGRIFSPHFVGPPVPDNWNVPELPHNLPSMQHGGVVYGPKSGYWARLHGDERIRVEPLDKPGSAQQINVYQTIQATDPESFLNQWEAAYSRRKERVTMTVVDDIRRRPQLSRSLRL